jgi:hypothetical protein
LTPLGVVAVGSVSIALVAGLVWSPRLREPGRSERDGIQLALPGAESSSADPDWTYSPVTTTVRPNGASVTIQAHAAGLLLISRPLPLVQGDCYIARVQFATTDNVGLAILSETADVLLQETKVEPSSVLRPERLEFIATSWRLTLGIVTREPNARATLGASSVSGRPCD